MTVKMRTEPTAPEVSNWNRQARQPSTTWVRTGYNAYLTLQKCGYLWTAVKCAEPGNLIRVGFQSLAVPLAERTGSETVKKCAYVASEGIGAVFTPISWCVGKACQWIGSTVANQVTKQLDIQNPELRDLVDIAASELSTYSAGKVTKRIEQARTPTKETTRTTLPKKPTTQVPPKIVSRTEAHTVGKAPIQRPRVNTPTVSVPKPTTPPQPRIVQRVQVTTVGKAPIQRPAVNQPTTPIQKLAAAPKPRIVQPVKVTTVGKAPIQRPSVNQPTAPIQKLATPPQPKIVPRPQGPSVGKQPPENMLSKKRIEKNLVFEELPLKKVLKEAPKGKTAASLRARIVKKTTDAATTKKPEQPKNDRATPDQPAANNTCTIVPRTPAEIATAEKRVESANQKVVYLGALSGYSSIDIENVATQVYNDARNAQRTGALPVATIEKQLSEKYGIPMGTLTDSLTNAFASRNPDSHVTKRIQEALTAQQTNGNARTIAQQDLDTAKTTLQQIKEPSCEAVAPSQPTVSVPRPTNILELVNDSENIARQSGLEGNVFVQMRSLATALTGSDHGEQYENAYSSFYQGYAEWQRYRGEDKPTQYGFLTAMTDVLVNGASTVPVESQSRPWYQSALQFAGSNGIGFQINGNNLQLGTMAHPNLVTVSTNPLSSVTSFSSTAGHTVANGIGEAAKNLDKVPGLEGLGTYLHGTVEKVTAVVGTLERIDDPDFQHESGGQRIGCAIWGTAVETAGEAIVLPLTGVAAAVAGAAITPFSEKAGDDAQQNCHDVINMGRDFVNSLTH